MVCWSASPHWTAGGCDAVGMFGRSYGEVMMSESQSTLVAQCSCGAKFRVPQEMAGRKAKCYQCGGVVQVPQAGSTTRGPRKRPVSARRKVQETSESNQSQPDKIRVRCDCGAKIAMPISAAGKRVRCPKCSQGIVIPTLEQLSHNNSAIAGRDSSLTPNSSPTPDQDEAALEDLMALSEGDEVDDLDPPALVDDDLYTFREQSFLQAAEPKEPSTSVIIPKKDLGPPLICPACNEELEPGVRICIPCGIDAKTGRAPLMVEDHNLDDAYIYAENTLQFVSWLVPFSFFPVVSEAFGTRVPWAVRGVGLFCILFSLWGFGAITCISNPTPEAQNLMLWPNELLADQSLSAIQPAQVATAVAPSDPNDPNSLIQAMLAVGTDPNDPNDPNVYRDAWDASAAYRTADLQAQGIGFRSYQLITHQFLHADALHLFGNLLFLFILGSRVNALIGNYLTIAIYPILGIIAGLVHLEMADNQYARPMLGASGAIMGMAGMYLVLFPAHKVHTAFWFRLGFMGMFSLLGLMALLTSLIPGGCFFGVTGIGGVLWISFYIFARLFLNIIPIRGFWFVLAWMAFDAFYVYFQIEDGTAHWAHLGGFMGGVVIAIGLLLARLINARGGDLISILLGKHSWGLMGKPTAQRLSLP